MKKQLIIGLLAGVSFGAFAQEGKLVSTWNALESYKRGDGEQNLESALPYINEAIENESTMNNTKAWWYRSQVYQFISTEKNLKDKYPNASEEALRSFKKMLDLNNPKFKDWDDATKNLQALATTVFNNGVEQFGTKEYARAAKNFASVEDINAIIEAKGGKPAIDLKTALGNAAIGYENAQDVNGAVGIYNKLIQKFPESKYYNILFSLYKKNNMLVEAKAVVDKGLVVYPTDKDLLISKVNFFVNEGKTAEAIEYLQKLIAQDPKNEQFQAVLGQAYEQSGDEANARKTYEGLTNLNPNSFEGSYGLGALIFNKAKSITDQMNALGYSKADQVKYEELKKVRAGIFAEAKPYLERALALKPENPQVKAALGNIETLSK